MSQSSHTSFLLQFPVNNYFAVFSFFYWLIQIFEDRAEYIAALKMVRTEANSYL